MTMYLFNILLATTISITILLITKLLALQPLMNREKSTPFECGFDPKNSARLPFSTRFFILAVIFLVFDIEIALLMPIPLYPSFNLTPMFLFSSAMFFLILLLGLFHEWKEGSLDWTN